MNDVVDGDFGLGSNAECGEAHSMAKGEGDGDCAKKPSPAPNAGADVRPRPSKDAPNVGVDNVPEAADEALFDRPGGDVPKNPPVSGDAVPGGAANDALPAQNGCCC